MCDALVSSCPIQLVDNNLATDAHDCGSDNNVGCNEFGHDNDVVLSRCHGIVAMLKAGFAPANAA